MTHPLQQKLQKLTQNLWWTWRPEVRAIFRDIDLDQYHKAHRNPLRLLREVDAPFLEQRAAEVDIQTRTDRALRQLNEYLNPVSTWVQTRRLFLRRIRDP
jgi:starch phosphorylase